MDLFRGLPLRLARASSSEHLDRTLISISRRPTRLLPEAMTAMAAEKLEPPMPRSSLPDLVQANALGRNTCRIAVATEMGRGTIHIEEGEVVDARYGDL